MEINSECLGSGEPLLFLHGWGHSAKYARPFGELMQERRAVHLLDLPGFGETEAPADVWSTFDYADRIAAYMDEKGIVKADIAGHSFGGKVALCLAMRHPHRVKSLVLMATSGFRRCLSRKKRTRAQVIRWAGKGVKAIDYLLSTKMFPNRFAPAFGSSDYQKAGPMRAILVKTLQDDMTDELSSVTCPTLLLWGDQDEATPPKIAYHLNKHIANSKLILHPNKGHLLYEDVGAHLCAKHILAFLEEVDG